MLKIGTHWWMGRQAEEVIIQQLQARIGISFIFTGSIIQVVIIWNEVMTRSTFWITIGITLLVDFIVAILSIIRYKNSVKAYNEKWNKQMNK